MGWWNKIGLGGGGCWGLVYWLDYLVWLSRSLLDSWWLLARLVQISEWWLIGLRVLILWSLLLDFGNIFFLLFISFIFNIFIYWFFDNLVLLYQRLLSHRLALYCRYFPTNLFLRHVGKFPWSKILIFTFPTQRSLSSNLRVFIRIPILFLTILLFLDDLYSIVFWLALFGFIFKLDLIY